MTTTVKPLPSVKAATASNIMKKIARGVLDE